jgi:hypothetical protein
MQLLSGGKRAPNRLVIGPAIFLNYGRKYITHVANKNWINFRT